MYVITSDATIERVMYDGCGGLGRLANANVIFAGLVLGNVTHQDTNIIRSNGMNDPIFDCYFSDILQPRH